MITIMAGLELGVGVVEVCLADMYDKRIIQFCSIHNLTGTNRKK